MRSLLLIVLFTTSIHAQALKQYADPQCPFSFWYPAGWHLQSEGCAVVLKPDNDEQLMRVNGVDVYDVVIDWGEGSFDEGARAAGFEIDPLDDILPAAFPGEWVVYGRQHMVSVAHPVLANAYRGLEAQLITGCYREHGGYAGLCDFRVIFLSDDRRWVSITAAPETMDTAEVILNNFCWQ